jgi:hypothetical protein
MAVMADCHAVFEAYFPVLTFGYYFVHFECVPVNEASASFTLMVSVLVLRSVVNLGSDRTYRMSFVHFLD